MTRETFPPYTLLAKQYVVDGDRKTEKLTAIYKKTQTQGWDGPETFDRIMAKHGGIQASHETRVRLAHVCSKLFWGELAAWNVSADLALALEDVDAKMAATGQVFDEARHFTVFRSYLKALDVEIPPLDGFTVALLQTLIDEKRLAHKLLGMQLLVENLAVNLFKAFQAHEIEPVLSELVGYYIKDESRHIGLGVMYLPKLLSNYSRWDTIQFQLYEKKLMSLVGWGGRVLAPHLGPLGVDYNALTRNLFRTYNRALQEIAELPEGAPARSIKPVDPQMVDTMIDIIVPKDKDAIPDWHRNILGGLDKMANVTEGALRWLLA